MISTVNSYLKILAKKFGFGGTYCQGNFKSFDEAKSKTGIIGYDESSFIENIKEKSKHLEDKIINDKNQTNDDLLIVLAICLSSNGNKINILDIGGGFGIHYLNSKKFVPEKIKSWDIIETSGLVSNSESFSNEILKFYENIKESKNKIKNIDLAILASSIQYIPNTKDFILELCELKPTYILITRTPLGKKQSYVAIQKSKLSSNYRGSASQRTKGNVFYPINIIEKDALLKAFSDTYDVMFTSENPKSNFYSNWEELKVFNILLKLKQKL